MTTTCWRPPLGLLRKLLRRGLLSLALAPGKHFLLRAFLAPPPAKTMPTCFLSKLSHDILGCWDRPGCLMRRWGGLPPPTAFGSISLGMSRAAHGLSCMMEQVAIRAQRRRCLTRPTYR